MKQSTCRIELLNSMNETMEKEYIEASRTICMVVVVSLLAPPPVVDDPFPVVPPPPPPTPLVVVVWSIRDETTFSSGKTVQPRDTKTSILCVRVDAEVDNRDTGDIVGRVV